VSDTATIGHAVVVADTTDLQRDEWLALRRQGIGGSDVSAIVGLSQYRTPLSVWLEKTGVYVPEDNPTESMEWGNLLEPIVADEFSRRSGVPTEAFRCLLAHPDHPHLLANVDRVIPPHGDLAVAGIYEGKTTSPWNRKDWGTEDDPRVPDHAALQTHHYLGVTGLPYAYVAVLIGGQQLVWRFIERDEEIVDRLLVLEQEFWQRVVENDPPPPTERDSQLLSEFWTPNPDETLVLTDELLAALAEREEVKAKEKAAKARAKELDELVQAELFKAGVEYGVNDEGQVVCTWREVAAGRVEAYDRVAYRRFTVNRKAMAHG
jgi:putative phage-type endonuclease